MNLELPTDEAILKRLNLGGLIKDWGGFEKLVAELNATGSVTVEHDVKLVGKSGASRQIDVLIRHRQGLIEHLVLVDCKRWKSRVSRSDVDSLVNTVRELNASRGVLFSVMGFESGAIAQAKADGIDLFTVRELTDAEWGLPGRHIDFFLHIVSKSIANVSSPGALGYGVTQPVHFDFRFTGDGDQSSTPIKPYVGSNAKTLEELIQAIAQDAASKAWKPQVLFDGKPGKRLFWKSVEAKFHSDLQVPMNGGFVLLKEIKFDVGVSILQSRFQFDRGTRYAFALAVKDEVRGITKAASREVGDETTALTDLHTPENKGQALVNGSIMMVWLAPFFDWADLTDLSKGEFRDQLD